ncbi:MAG: type II toxin-antitoxin system Phd/YefM family antitoxin [Blastocatellia bacterium]
MHKPPTHIPLPMIISTTAARRHFDEILDGVTDRGERFYVTYRGRRMAALVSAAELKCITGPKRRAQSRVMSRRSA